MGAMIDKPATSTSADTGPALVVTFGATSQKTRLLHKPATLIGRNRGCDIRLDAPEISGLHCLVCQYDGALTIRDCDSRAGVIVNGRPVRESELKDGDLLQLGPFTFTVRLPSLPTVDAAIAPEKYQELEDQVRSLQHHVAGVEAERDKLATQLHESRCERDAAAEQVRVVDGQAGELNELRRRVHETEQARVSLDRQVQEGQNERQRLLAEIELLRTQSARKTEDWEKKLESLSTRLTAAEEEREAARAELAERPIQQEHSAVDEETEHRLAWLEEELEKSALDLRKCRGEIESLEQAAASHQAESIRLRKQADENDHELAKLRSERDQQLRQIEDLQADIPEDRSEEIAALQEEIEALRGHLADAESQSATLEQDRADQSELEVQLREWQSSHDRLEEELKSAQEAVDQALAEAAQWRTQAESKPTAGHSSEEVERLRQEIAKLQDDMASVSSHRDDLQAALVDTRTGESGVDVAALQSRIAQVESERDELASQRTLEQEQNERRLAHLRQQLETERQQMKQLVIEAAADHDRTRAELEALRRGEGIVASADGGPALTTDIAEYEAQLNQFREQLESAQNELVERERHLEIEKDQITEQLKQAELELSRERATIARERAEIERARREMLAEAEHLERSSHVRARLASVDQLANEMKGRSQESPQAPPAASLSDRLRGMLGRGNGQK
jgi:chromosome segregation ATPase